MSGQPPYEFECSFYPGAIKHPHHCEVFGGFEDAERGREIRRAERSRKRQIPYSQSNGNHATSTTSTQERAAP